LFNTHPHCISSLRWSAHVSMYSSICTHNTIYMKMNVVFL
jgi:hypothetical protein